MLKKALVAIRDRPTTVFIRRNDITHDKSAYPQPEIIRRSRVVKEAPRPPIDSQFAGVGRDAEHAPTGIIAYGGGLAIDDWLSVMAWPFSQAKIPSAMVIRDMPNRGKQVPFMERANIVSPPQTTLGDLYALQGASSWSPNLAKITV